MVAEMYPIFPETSIYSLLKRITHVTDLDGTKSPEVQQE